MLYCSMCHTSNSEILKYCKNCGEPLKNKHTKAERLEKLLVDRYRVMSPLKIGAMSGVYLAKDIRLNSLCAVKELYIKLFPDDDRDLTIQNFKSEAELLANLRHPSLPRVIDYFYEEGKYYLVMDYISGCDLFTILEKDGIPWLSQEVVLPWGIEICDVLIYLHNQSPPVIYRDLKPSNIMIRKNDQKLMLVDFGLAQMFHFKPASNEKALGTQGYAPPEQYAGREEPRSDLYSLGVTLHHLLSGTPPETPFKFQSLREINKDISPEIDKIIMKAIERYA
ncbi:MAG TPA: serine/threonine-protein kinase [Candidatus Eremiobacteraeota bacterium]|nr:serine/threonine-protein kinase [Candidatus Eremiobacteraeota bacterium]